MSLSIITFIGHGVINERIIELLSNLSSKKYEDVYVLTAFTAQEFTPARTYFISGLKFRLLKSTFLN